MSEKTIRYVCDLSQDGDSIATGTMTVVCVRTDVTPLKAVSIPPEIAARFEVGRPATGPDTARCIRPNIWTATPWRRGRARACRGCSPTSTAATRSTRDKLDAAGVRLDALALPADLTRLPLTTKAELVADQAANPPWGTALTEPLASYTRYCQTSSTTGRPLRWIDTNESWQWMLECWKAVYRAARVEPGDRVFFPFSFGPFLGFWAGFEAGLADGPARACPAAACRARCGWR